MSVSLSVDRVQTVTALDPRMNLTGKRVYAVESGPQESTWQPNVSTSFSGSTITWSVSPPAGIVVDRKMYMQIPVTISFVLTSNVGGSLPIQLGTMDGLRAFPISAMTTSISATLNNSQVSMQSYDTVPWLARFMKEDYLDFSMTPAMLDYYQSYGDWLGGGPVGGVAEHPLASAGQQERDVSTRGGFSYGQVIMATNTAGALSATCSAVLIEPILLSPFYAGKGNAAGFFGLNNLLLNLTLGEKSRCWCHDNGPSSGANYANQIATSPSGITVTIGGAALANSAYAFGPAGGGPTLLLNYLTPLDISRLPRSCSYEYEEIQVFKSDQAALASGATVSAPISSNNIILQSLPKKIYIWVAQTLSTRSFASTDTMAGIKSLSMNINNRTGLFASCSQMDLYAMAIRNGSSQSWQSFAYFTGSMLCIDPASDIGLGPDLAPSVVGSVNLQVSVSYYNPVNYIGLNSTASGVSPATVSYMNSRADVSYTIYIMTVSDGIFTLAEGRAVSSTAVLTPSDALHAKSSGPVVAQAAFRENAILSGGSKWYGDCSKFLANCGSGGGMSGGGSGGCRGSGAGDMSSSLKSKLMPVGGSRRRRRRHGRRRRRHMRGGGAFDGSSSEAEGGSESGSDGEDSDGGSASGYESEQKEEEHRHSRRSLADMCR